VIDGIDNQISFDSHLESACNTVDQSGTLGTGPVQIAISPAPRQPRIPPNVKDAMTQVVGALKKGTLVTGTANFFVCGVIPSLPHKAVCKAATGATAAGMGFLLWYLDRLSSDPPDPHFMSIAQPIIPSFPPVTTQDGITQAEADTLNALFSNLAHAIGFADALLISIERAQGAANAGDTFWEEQQMEAAAQHAARLATFLNAQPALHINVQNAMQAAGFPSIPITPDDISNFQSGIAINGLPTSITEVLTQLGADSATIDEIRNLLLTQDPAAAAGSFPETFWSLANSVDSRN
jgi:hypothetical protein